MREKYRGKTVIVTGGLGFVGRNLVDALVEAEVREIVIVDDCSNSRPVLPANWPSDRVRHIQQSVLDTQWREQLPGVDVVFHLACKTILECDANPLYDLDINARSTLEILEDIRTLPESDRPTFIYASSACVYGIPPQYAVSETEQLLPTHQYGVSKLAGERYTYMYAKSYAIKSASLRLSNVYGPHQHPKNPYCGVIGIFLTQAQEGKPLRVIGDGTQSRDFTYATDTVAALMAIAVSDSLKGEVYNISAGQASTINQLVDAVKEVYQDVEIEHVPLRHIDDISFRLLDSGKIKSVIGDLPSTSLQDGIRLTAAWIQAEDSSVL